MSVRVNKTVPSPDVHMIRVKDKKRTASVCLTDRESVPSVQFKPTWTSLAGHVKQIVTATLKSDQWYLHIKTPLDPIVRLLCFLKPTPL